MLITTTQLVNVPFQIITFSGFAATTGRSEVQSVCRTAGDGNIRLGLYGVYTGKSISDPCLNCAVIIIIIANRKPTLSFNVVPWKFVQKQSCTMVVETLLVKEQVQVPSPLQIKQQNSNSKKKKIKRNKTVSVIFKVEVLFSFCYFNLNQILKLNVGVLFNCMQLNVSSAHRTCCLCQSNGRPNCP